MSVATKPPEGAAQIHPTIQPTPGKCLVVGRGNCGIEVENGLGEHTSTIGMWLALPCLADVSGLQPLSTSTALSYVKLSRNYSINSPPREREGQQGDRRPAHLGSLL